MTEELIAVEVDERASGARSIWGHFLRKCNLYRPKLAVASREDGL